MSDNNSLGNVTGTVPKEPVSRIQCKSPAYGTRSRSREASARVPDLNEEEDVFRVNLAEYLEDIMEDERDMDRTGLEGVMDANNITKAHVRRRENSENSFIRCLEKVGELCDSFVVCLNVWNGS